MTSCNSGLLDTCYGVKVFLRINLLKKRRALLLIPLEWYHRFLRIMTFKSPESSQTIWYYEKLLGNHIYDYSTLGWWGNPIIGVIRKPVKGDKILTTLITSKTLRTTFLYNINTLLMTFRALKQHKNYIQLTNNKCNGRQKHEN